MTKGTTLTLWREYIAFNAVANGPYFAFLFRVLSPIVLVCTTDSSMMKTVLRSSQCLERNSDTSASLGTRENWAGHVLPHTLYTEHSKLSLVALFQDINCLLCTTPSPESSESFIFSTSNSTTNPHKQTTNGRENQVTNKQVVVEQS